MIHSTFTIPTSQSPDLVIARIQGITQPEASWQEMMKRFSFLARPERSKPFHGNTGRDWFHIQREAGLSPGYLAVVQGKVSGSPHGSLVTVKVHLSPVGHFLLGGILVLVVAGLLNYAAQYPGLPSSVLTTLGVTFLAGLVILLGGYVPEVYRVKRLLRETLGQDGARTGVSRI